MTTQVDVRAESLSKRVQGARQIYADRAAAEYEKIAGQLDFQTMEECLLVVDMDRDTIRDVGRAGASEWLRRHEGTEHMAWQIDNIVVGPMDLLVLFKCNDPSTNTPGTEFSHLDLRIMGPSRRGLVWLPRLVVLGREWRRQFMTWFSFRRKNGKTQ